ISPNSFISPIIFDVHTAALSRIGVVLGQLGCADQGRAKIRDAISLSERLSERLKSPTIVTYALSLACISFIDLREPANVQVVAERLFAIANEQQLPALLAYGSVYRGWAMAEQGRTDEGIALIRSVLYSYVTLGNRADLPWALTALSEAQARAGQLEE